MQRALLLGLCLILVSSVVVTTTGAATVCDVYYDSQATSYQGQAVCWLSGKICHQCYDTYSGDSCAANWDDCNPKPLPEIQTASLFGGGEEEGRWIQVCRRSSSPSHSLTAEHLL